MAPFGMRPAVGTPCETVSAWPAASKPVTVTAPCALARVWPSGPASCVRSSVPPISDVASPNEDTVTSSRWPESVPTARSAVTITAATFWFRNELPRMLSPMRSSMDWSD